MRIFWPLLRHSATVWAGFLIAAVEVWLALSSRTPGLNLWADLVTGTSVASLYVGVIAAGFSAFEAGRWAPLAVEHGRGTPRTPTLVRVLHAAVAAVPILSGYLLALALLGLYASATGVYGSPSPGWLVALGCALLAAAGFGWVIGTVGGGRWWVAPAAAVAFYGLYVVVNSLPLPYGIKALYPVVLQQDFVFVRPVLTTMLGMATFSLGAVLLALLLIGRDWRPTARRVLAIVCIAVAVIALGGAGASLVRNGQYTESYRPPDTTCTRGTATICLNPGYAAALPALQRRVTIMNQRVAGTALVATRLEQDIEGDPPAPDGARSIHIEQLAAPDDINLTVYRYLTQYGLSDTCQYNGTYSTGARVLVDTWLSGYAASARTPAEDRILQRMRALPVEQSNAWFRKHFRQYFSCTLKVTDLP